MLAFSNKPTNSSFLGKTPLLELLIKVEVCRDTEINPRPTGVYAPPHGTSFVAKVLRESIKLGENQLQGTYVP